MKLVLGFIAAGIAGGLMGHWGLKFWQAMIIAALYGVMAGLWR